MVVKANGININYENHGSYIVHNDKIYEVIKDYLW